MRPFRRVSRIGATLVLAMMVLAAARQARAEAAVRWKFKPGETLNYVIDRALEGKINLSGADITFKMNMIFDATWKVKSVAADGTAEIEQTLDRMQINMNSPLGGNLAFDSQKPDKPSGPTWSQLEPMVTNMLGQTMQLKISPLGKVSDIKLPEKLADFFEKKKKSGPSNRDAGFGIGAGGFSEAGIKEMIEKSVLPLPDAAQPKDVTWKQHFEHPIPLIGTQMIDTTFSFAGSETVDGAPLVKISSATELTFEPEENPRADLEITDQQSSANYYFDAEAGRLVKSSGSDSSSLELTGQQDLTQQLTETWSMRLGKSPEAKASEADAKTK